MQDDGYLDFDLDAYLEREDDRLRELAHDEITRVDPSLPPSVLERAIEKIRDSYEVGDPDFDREGNIEGAVEFFRLDTRTVITHAKREQLQAIRGRRPIRPTVVVRSRGTSRAPRRAGRRRTRATARSPGRDDPSEPSDIGRCPLWGVSA